MEAVLIGTRARPDLAPEVIPDWLVSVLIQFPIVVVISFVAWYAYGQIKLAQDQARVQEKESFDARINDLHASYQRLIDTKDQEMARLRDELLGEIQRLGQKIDGLNRKLS